MLGMYALGSNDDLTVTLIMILILLNFVYRETVLVFPCEAGHVTCLDCFHEYCIVRLQERRFEFDTNEGYYTLSCPAGCSNSFIQEVHHFHLLNTEQVRNC